VLFLDDLLLLPVTGFKFVLNTLRQVAEEQYTDTGPAKARLLELQVQLEDGEITEQEYVAAEAEVFREIREIEQRRRELAGKQESE
jgi:hypothetical protein